DHVEGELDVSGGERLAVVPPDVLAQEEDEVPVAVLPRPLLCEIPHHGVDALHALELVEDHEVVEAGQGRPHGGDGGRLVYGDADGELLALHQVDHAARLGRLPRRGGGGERQRRRDDRDEELHAATGWKRGRPPGATMRPGTGKWAARMIAS